MKYLLEVEEFYQFEAAAEVKEVGPRHHHDADGQAVLHPWYDANSV